MALVDRVDLINEMIEEDMEVLKELYESDFVPLIKHREKLEREAFERAYKDMRVLEAPEEVLE